MEIIVSLSLNRNRISMQKLFFHIAGCQWKLMGYPDLPWGTDAKGTGETEFPLPDHVFPSTGKKKKSGFFLGCFEILPFIYTGHVYIYFYPWMTFNVYVMILGQGAWSGLRCGQLASTIARIREKANPSHLTTLMPWTIATADLSY